MSAATHLSISLPAPDLSISAAVDTIEADVEIRVHGGLDPATEEAIQSAKKAADILSREYGLYAIVIPTVLYWSHGFLAAPTLSVPIIEINGEEAVIGRAPSPMEIVEEVLARLGIKSEPRLLLAPRSGGDDGETAQVTW